MGILGVLASVALLIGSIEAAMVVSDGHQLAAQETNTPVVEVQAIQTDSAPLSSPFDL